MATKQDKYTKFARGKPCQIRIPGICKPAPGNETSVLCHLNGAGMGTRHYNIHGAIGCAACHDVVDGRVDVGWSDWEIKAWHLEGVIRTQIMMIEEGVLVL